ncbi:alpha-amlyase [Flavisolibacter tropicus]|uniref:Alpha-amlyase n=1 Tax=Flavisolibacter tropicus TaxID=1492898 RepID=A0A172U2N2_9BACT|nr:alpha-amlyase [Flavisolibacter tropicus]
MSCTYDSSSQEDKTHTDSNLSAYQPKEYVELEHPEWSKNATIYEVNIRQYTPEGTFAAFEKHLPRLKQLGVDILWLMPIQPIGEKNRKGTLGSYYSIKDYYDVNPEFGKLEDLKHLVRKAHAKGMYVILDWVANHSSWDNSLATNHPDWYSKSKEGHFQSTPWRDYDDIIDFDYSHPGLRKYMTDAMAYWVKETDIDGFRCDVASFVPIDFWENARKELQAIKPVFMLAEAADRDLHKRAFDMTYAWSLWDHLHDITTNNKSINGLTEGYIAEHVSTWPRNAYRMNFVDNHDKNSWEGNQVSNFGDGLEAAIVLTATMDGMPLIYSGQEAGLDRSLRFFDKDTIQWQNHKIGGLYSRLFQLKHVNQALWNGRWGGEMDRIKNDQMSKVISFSREKNNDKVITVVNLSNQQTPVKLESQYHKGTYTELFSGVEYAFTDSTRFDLAPWSYLVMVKQK